MNNKLRIFLIIAGLCSLSVKAQQPCGVYRTFEDFRQQKISLHANPKFGEKAVQVGNFFLRPYIYIRTDNGKCKVSMDSTFAIRCSNGNVYRVWNKKAYLLVDTGFVKIYSYPFLETLRKRSSKGYRPVRQQVVHYYFSRDYSSPLANLTLTNIRLAFYLDENTNSMLLRNFPDNESVLGNHNHHFFINDFFSNLKQ